MLFGKGDMCFGDLPEIDSFSHFGTMCCFYQPDIELCSPPNVLQAVPTNSERTLDFMHLGLLFIFPSFFKLIVNPKLKYIQDRWCLCTITTLIALWTG